MARVRSKDTKPEIIVRKILHSRGFRYRLHVRYLPGRPDLVFVRSKKVIFVHGCFWHRHTKCARCTTPSANSEFWKRKFDENIERDKKNLKNLKQQGWQPLIVWECELDDLPSLTKKLTSFLIST